MIFKPNMLPPFSSRDWTFSNAIFDNNQLLTVRPGGFASITFGGLNVNLNYEYTPEAYRVGYNTISLNVGKALIRVVQHLTDGRQVKLVVPLKYGTYTHICEIKENSANQVSFEIYNNGTDNLLLKAPTLEPSEGIASLVNDVNSTVVNLGETVKKQGTEIKANAQAIELRATYTEVQTMLENAVGDIEASFPNIIMNSDYRFLESRSNPWDKTLNGEISASLWTDYDAAVVSPSTGYHAHLNDKKFPETVMVFQSADITRRLTSGQTLMTGRIKGNKDFVFSMDVYSETAKNWPTVSLQYTLKNGTTQTVQSTMRGTKTQTWERLWFTFKTHIDLDVTKPVNLLIQAYQELGITYVKRSMLHLGKAPLDWSCSAYDLDKYVTYMKEQIAEITVQVGKVVLQVGEVEKKVDKTDTRLTEEIKKVNASIVTMQNQIDLKVTRDEVTTIVDKVKIGGRNLLLKSNEYVRNSSYQIMKYTFGNLKPIVGKEYICTIKGILGAGKTKFTLFNSGGSIWENDFKDNLDGTFTCKIPAWKIETADNTQAWVYAYPSSVVVDSTIEWIKLESGNKETEYTTAPEDTDVIIDEVKNTIASGGRNFVLDSRLTRNRWKTWPGVVDILSAEATKPDVKIMHFRKTFPANSTNSSWGAWPLDRVFINAKRGAAITYSCEMYCTDWALLGPKGLIASLRMSNSPTDLTSAATLAQVFISDVVSSLKNNQWVRVSCSMTSAVDYAGYLVLRPFLFYATATETQTVDFKMREFKVEFSPKDTGYSPAPEDALRDLEIVNVKAEESKQLLSDIANDNKITPDEKQNTKKEWDVIFTEYPKIVKQATDYGVDKGAYITAYDTLNAYVTPLLSNLTTADDISGSTFRQRFTTYYDKRTELNDTIAKAITTTEISKIQIGGRNLVENSTFNQGLWVTSDYLNLITPMEDKKESYITKVAMGYAGTINGIPLYNPIRIKERFKRGDSLTISCDFLCHDFLNKYTTGTLLTFRRFESETSNTVTHHLMNPAGIDLQIDTSLAGKWQRISYTYTFTEDLEGWFATGLYVSNSGIAPGKAMEHFIREIKVERGNKPTAWSPASKDTLDAIKAVDTKAEDSKTKLADIANDGKLTAVEKAETQKEWDAIRAEYPKIGAQADKYFVLKSNYVAKYNALNIYITPILANLTITSDIVGATFRQKFTEYYDARTDLNALIAEAITSTEIGKIQIGGRNLLKNTSTEYKEVTMYAWNMLNYTLPLVDLGLKTGDAVIHSIYCSFGNVACGGSSRITFYDNANTNIQTTTGNIISKNSADLTTISTTVPANAVLISVGLHREIASADAVAVKFNIRNQKLEIGTKMTDWSPAPEDTLDAIKVVDTKAEDSKTKLADIANDGKLTAVEKAETQKEWDVIRNTYVKTVAQADRYRVNKDAYAAAYVALDGYITPLLTATGTSNINRVTFRKMFTDFYNAQTDLNNNISAMITKVEIDGLQIGGRNFLRTSGNYHVDSKTKWFPENGWEITQHEGFIRLTRTIAATGSWISLPTSISLEAGRELKCSIRFRRNRNRTFSVIVAPATATSNTGIIDIRSAPANQWMTLTSTSPWTTSLEIGRVLFTSTHFEQVGDYIDIEYIKLEDGKIPTAWSPAPEDIEEQYGDINNALNSPKTEHTIQKRITDIEGKGDGILRLNSIEGAVMHNLYAHPKNLAYSNGCSYDTGRDCIKFDGTNTVATSQCWEFPANNPKGKQLYKTGTRYTVVFRILFCNLAGLDSSALINFGQQDQPTVITTNIGIPGNILHTGAILAYLVITKDTLPLDHLGIRCFLRRSNVTAGTLYFNIEIYEGDYTSADFRGVPDHKGFQFVGNPTEIEEKQPDGTTKKVPGPATLDIKTHGKNILRDTWETTGEGSQYSQEDDIHIFNMTIARSTCRATQTFLPLKEGTVYRMQAEYRWTGATQGTTNYYCAFYFRSGSDDNLWCWEQGFQFPFEANSSTWKTATFTITIPTERYCRKMDFYLFARDFLGKFEVRDVMVWEEAKDADRTYQVPRDHSQAIQFKNPLRAVPEGPPQTPTWYVADSADLFTRKVTRRIGTLVLDGNEPGWVRQEVAAPSGGTVVRFYAPLPGNLGLKRANYRLPIRSTHFRTSIDGSEQREGLGFTYSKPTSYIYLYRPIATLEAWREWLGQQAAAGDPVTIYYVLDKPIIEDFVATRYLNGYENGTLIIDSTKTFPKVQYTATHGIIDTQEFLTASTDEDRALIFQQIANESLTLTRKFEADIKIMEKSIEQRVSEKYMATGDFEQWESENFSQIVQDVGKVTTTIGEVRKYTEEVDGKLVSYQTYVETYMRFDIDGLEIGKKDSEFRVKIDNTRMAFMQKNDVVAYISNKKLFIGEAEVTGPLTVSNGANAFTWQVRADGNFGLQRRSN